MHQSFIDNPDLKQAMNSGFELFMNQKIADFEMYEYLAFYSNEILLQDEKENIENDLTNIKHLYSYINSKENFVKIYQHLLAKRLLTQKTNDFYNEKSILNKIKELYFIYFYV